MIVLVIGIIATIFRSLIKRVHIHAIIIARAWVKAIFTGLIEMVTGRCASEYHSFDWSESKKRDYFAGLLDGDEYLDYYPV